MIDLNSKCLTIARSPEQRNEGNVPPRNFGDCFVEIAMPSVSLVVLYD